MNSGFHEKNGKEKINFFSSDSFVQQNTSSLWSINEPFCIHLVQGGRVNADEGMKVGVVLRGFFSHFAAQWNVAFTCLPISQFQL